MAQLSEHYNLTPCAFARRLLREIEAAIKASGAGGQAADLSSREKSRASDWMKEPNSLMSLPADELARAEARLRGLPLDVVVEDIENCHVYDLTEGRFSDRIKRIMGNEHELLLLDLLRASGIDGFLSEAGQRASVAAGTKTPDVLLSGTPLSVYGRDVFWIDSKACFADTQEIAMHWDKQFRNYSQSHGLGMVIYWQGYVADAPGPMMMGQAPGTTFGAAPEELELLAQNRHHLLLVNKQPQLLIVADFPPARLATSTSISE